ncbi:MULTISPECIES: cyclophilin-like fold protein [Xanthomonas]|uniref:Cyclophilin-like fold protein n=1 Tax=Xanthomonas dyei TaxID=743699 RepID=A0ABZ0DEG0_9XANT|nr:cyclophilin-like fold protein [Xanthomonas dyei]WOB27017.1 cyclophilin-like fold protein [Xanthomonas dyei]WOB54639.1 cyclophilin-like fold protein [Xanthomonas dyei]
MPILRPSACLHTLLLGCAFLVTACSAATPPAVTTPHTPERTMRITLTIGDDVVEAELVDHSATRDLFARLPMTVSFEDFHASEKISYLPTKLDLSAVGPAGPAQVGDLMYYVPWGNLAVFYRGYTPSRDLVRLGRIVSNPQALTRSASFTATIARAAPAAAAPPPH